MEMKYKECMISYLTPAFWRHLQDILIYLKDLKLFSSIQYSFSNCPDCNAALTHLWSSDLSCALSKISHSNQQNVTKLKAKLEQAAVRIGIFEVK